jgi:hypothetical protein
LFDSQVEGSHEEDSEDEEFAELMARYDKVFFVVAPSLARKKTVLRIRIGPPGSVSTRFRSPVVPVTKKK